MGTSTGAARLVYLLPLLFPALQSDRLSSSHKRNSILRKFPSPAMSEYESCIWKRFTALEVLNFFQCRRESQMPRSKQHDMFIGFGT